MLKFTFSLCALLSIAFCSFASENTDAKTPAESQVIEKDVQTPAFANNDQDNMENFPIITEQLLADGCGCGKGKNKNLACCGEEELKPTEENNANIKLACGECGGKHLVTATVTAEDEVVETTPAVAGA